MTGDARTELLISCLADRLAGCRHVAVGAASPIPAAAALLARMSSEGRLRVSILGSERHNVFTDGSKELFDCAAQGRIDAFFLGGGQIDGQANLNLVGVGGYPRSPVRWPGSFGSAYLYHLVPRVILFRLEHSPRVLVERVDFISAAGTSPAHHHRPGGPEGLITGKAAFRFDRALGRFTLTHRHPGVALADIVAATGFAFELAAELATTPVPSAATLAMIRGPVAADLVQIYPRFATEILTSPSAPLPDGLT